ncbi:MAG: hypothetical protein J6Y53_00650 [Alphaproteobacteria bacterium]|nr:hypothetical protein [Alphaproteobacteria bacterium]
MGFFGKYQSPFGYMSGDNGVDSYGVDHSGFSTQDELQYQTLRTNIENELANDMDRQEIPQSNYPQYGTSFWQNAGLREGGLDVASISPTVQAALNLAKNNSTNESAMKYAQNVLSTVMNDASGYNSNYISDDDLYKKMWNNIKTYENVKYHPYLDSKGYITTGGGANINNLNDFMKVNFMINGYPATDMQKLAAYNKLKELSNRKDVYGNYVNRNRTADSFFDDTNLQISEKDAYNMAKDHMINDLAYVRKEFANFDSFPNPLKEVLLDIQYNVKGGLNKQNWPNLYNAINNRDVNGIINNVHRKDVGYKRNNWAQDSLRSIKF